MAQAASLACTLDKAGDVCDHIGIFTRANNAQVGDESSERIIGDLRTSGAHAGDKRGFADRGHTHKSSIGHQLHLELDPVLNRRLALLGKSGCTSRRGDKMRIAASSGTAGSNNYALPVVCKVSDLIGGLHGLAIDLANHGSHGDLQDKVAAVLTVFTRTLAVGAALGTEMMLEAVINQRGQLRVSLDNNVAAMTAVAAVRTALGNICLSAERHAASAAVAALDIDAANIGKLGHLRILLVIGKTTLSISKEAPGYSRGPPYLPML